MTVENNKIEGPEAMRNLVSALRSSPCPAPTFTPEGDMWCSVESCISADCCGCDNRKAIEDAEKLLATAEQDPLRVPQHHGAVG